MIKLSKFRIRDEITYGKYRKGRFYPVSGEFKKKFRTIKSVIENGAVKDLLDSFDQNDHGYSIQNVNILPPIFSDSRVFCVGLNYPKNYMPDSSLKKSTQMVLFSKVLDSFVGSESPIIIPKGQAGKSLDYEGELGLVIGKPGKNIPLEEAYKHIFGFTIVNDGSVRDWQKHSIFAGKNFECSSSCGPCILVNQEGLRPEDFVLTTRLNNKLVQDTKIKNMTFSCAEIVVYISKILTIKPGDVIATGSPDGSGISRNPNRFLRNGDCLEIEISNIGILRNNILSHD